MVMEGEAARRTEILALADHALAEIQRYKARWLATGDLTAYRLWEAAERDRRMLLDKVSYGRDEADSGRLA